MTSTSRSNMATGQPSKPTRPEGSQLVAHSITLIVLTAFFFVADGVIVAPIVTNCNRSVKTANTLVNIVTNTVDFISLFYHPVTNGLSSLIDGELLITTKAILCVITNIVCYLTSSANVLITTHVIGKLNFTYNAIYLTA